MFGLQGHIDLSTMCVEVVEVSYFYDQNSSRNVSRTTHKFSENKENIILQPLQIDSESRILEEEEFFQVSV